MNTDATENVGRAAVRDQLVGIRVEHATGAAVVHVAGELDLVTTPALRDAIADALSSPPPLVVLDLTDVDFLASAGLSELIAAGERAQGRTTLRIVAANRSTLRPLSMTGLDSMLAVFPTVDEALAAPVAG